MVQQSSFFNKLKKLFSGEVIVRHVGKKQLKIIDTDTKQLAHGVDRFNRLRKRDTINLGVVNQYSYSDTRIELFRDYECMAGETKIPLPDGTEPTLKELAERYPTKDDKFYVFSYDHKSDSIKLGEAHSVRKTKTDMTYKIKFDNGQELIATANHPFLMRDGNYKRVDELEIGESVMPNPLKSNYTIVSIEEHKILDVYDMTVEKYHNFSTEVCFVHNSMDRDAIISSALDLLSEEASVKNEFGDVLNIQSDNQDIKEILENLYYDILNIEFTLPSWVRNLIKYGDFFLYLDIHEDYGVTNVIPISVYDIKRLEGDNPNDPYELKFIIGEQVREPAENFQVAHFRLLSDANFLPYGRSGIEGARKVWKKLHLMEDAMLIHRIMRAPERRIYKIDVGNLPPDEVDNYMNNIIQSTKKIPFMDPTTGDYNLKFNLMNVMEDYFIPTRGGQSGTDIDIAPALNYDAIEDIEYLRNKMMAALRIPKAFLSYDEGIGSKATLAAEDLRFARTVEKIQRIIVSELYKIAIVHLYAQGYRDEDLVNFELHLTSPSVVYEEEKIALWDAKTALAASIRDINLLSTDWIYTELFKLSKSEADLQKENLLKDAFFEYRLAKILEDGEDPVPDKWDSLENIDSEMIEDSSDEVGDEDTEEGNEGTLSEPGNETDMQSEPGEQGRSEESSGTSVSSGGEAATTPIMAGESIDREKNKKKREQDRKKSKKDKDDDPLGLKDLKKTLSVSRSDIKHRYKGGSPLSIKDYRQLDKWLMKNNKNKVHLNG